MRHESSLSGGALFLWNMMLLVLAGWSLCLGGCASASAGGRSAGAPTIATVTADYDAGRFQQAYDNAVTLSRRGELGIRDQASYLAGLSAYRLQQYLSVDRYLAPLTHTSDPVLAGRAAGTLGLADMERGNYREAATHFKEAADRLKGQEKAEAAFRAGLAYKEASLSGQARVQFIIARGASKDAAFLARVERELKSSGYTLQLGVFAGRSNAESMAKDFQNTAAATRLGPARVVVGRGDRGEALYYVQVGTFSSYTAAIRGRALLDQPAIVRPLEASGE